MDAAELRQLGVDELRAKIRQLHDEKFRTRFRAMTSETKDTSAARKVRRTIARAETVLNEKLRETK